MTFRSKIDAWIALLSVGAAAACLGGLIHVALTKSILEAMVVSPLLLLGIVLPPWLLTSTYYVLGDTELLVKSGPLQWRVPLVDIRAVTPTRSALSSPALSLDRLRIDYQRWKSIMISPADQEGFLQELENRRSRLAV